MIATVRVTAVPQWQRSSSPVPTSSMRGRVLHRTKTGRQELDLTLDLLPELHQTKALCDRIPPRLRMQPDPEPCHHPWKVSYRRAARSGPGNLSDATATTERASGSAGGRQHQMSSRAGEMRQPSLPGARYCSRHWLSTAYLHHCFGPPPVIAPAVPAAVVRAEEAAEEAAASRRQK